EGDIGDSLQMQAEQPIVEDLLHQHDRAIDELLLVAHECDDHSNGDRIIESESRRDIYSDDHLKPKDRVIRRFEAYCRAPQPDIRVDEIGVAIEPLSLALVLRVQELQTLNRAHALDECRVLLRLGSDDLLVAP